MKQMYYINAKKLVDMAIEHGILQTKDGCILIYRNAGTDPVKYPEGWYLEDFELVYQEVTKNKNAQRLLIAALSRNGVVFKEIQIDCNI